MNKFDEEVNNTLARKIAKMESDIVKKLIIKRKKNSFKTPNTPNNVPVSSKSPALHRGINKDVADTPMPLSVGV